MSQKKTLGKIECVTVTLVTGYSDNLDRKCGSPEVFGPYCMGIPKKNLDRFLKAIESHLRKIRKRSRVKDFSVSGACQIPVEDLAFNNVTGIIKSFCEYLNVKVNWPLRER